MLQTGKIYEEKAASGEAALWADYGCEKLLLTATRCAKSQQPDAQQEYGSRLRNG